jgi:hypothetical protein
MQPVQRRGDVRHPEVEQGTAVGELRWNVPDQFEGDRAVQVLRRVLQGPGTVSAVHGEAPLIRRELACLVVARSQGVGQRTEPVDDQGIEQRLPARKVAVQPPLC